MQNSIKQTDLITACMFVILFFFDKERQKEIISDDKYFIRERQSEQMYVFCTWNKMCISFDCRKWKPVTKKIRNQYIIWLTYCFTIIMLLHCFTLPNRSLEIFKDCGQLWDFRKVTKNFRKLQFMSVPSANQSKMNK